MKELEQQAADNKVAALTSLELALELANRETPIDQLNAARYFLCWLYWAGGRVDEAAVLGEFVATPLPEERIRRVGGAGGAGGVGEDVQRNARTGAAAQGAAPVRLPRASCRTSRSWSPRGGRGRPQASSAVNVLIGVALREKRLDEAEKLLASLPAESRATAELRLGSALWVQYLQMSSGRSERPQSPRPSRMRDEAAGARWPVGFRGRPARAAIHRRPRRRGACTSCSTCWARATPRAHSRCCRTKPSGRSTLVEAKTAAASEPRFVQETYKTALRAYLSPAPPDRQKGRNGDGVARSGGGEVRTLPRRRS